GSPRGKGYGLPMAAGGGARLPLSPGTGGPGASGFREALLQGRLFENPNQDARLLCGHICLVENTPDVSLNLRAADIQPSHCALCTTDNGSYSLTRAAWGLLQSKYDGLLHANLIPDYPATRRAMLSHFRIWLRWRDYSQELGLDCQTDFQASYDNSLAWRFDVSFSPCHPAFLLTVRWDLAKDCPAGRLSIQCAYPPEDDMDKVQVVVRPYVDVRNHHGVTKAYAGAEQEYPQAVAAEKNGFAFTPWGQAALVMRSPRMSFVKCPEWHYGLPLPVEQERGLEDSMDVFSPGCFMATCTAGDTVHLETAAAPEARLARFPTFEERKELALARKPLPLLECLKSALTHFIVRRNEHSTIMAGYPWFLDWGRDTLICLRGLTAAGMHAEVRDTIVQFAKFEQNGTLPNMLRGDDASDRDTSDAPLWLFASVKAQLEHGDGNPRQFLNADCGGRTLAQVLLDLGTAIWDGKTTNGVRCDQESGLVFSPPHFTWMDTNYPAGTPREGYPVEIQALWVMALRMLAKLGRKSLWQPRAEKAADSLRRLFVRPDGRGLSDCLHCRGFAPAASATPDDAVRPNQLFAITLQAIADEEIAKGILRACEPLLIPGAIRSLDDADVTFSLPIYDQGRLLNDPGHPYWPKYSGLEDVTRKPAYHNGTAWAWQAPAFFEAFWMVYGKEALPRITPWLYSVQKTLMDGCLGFLPEISDGSYPHTQKGCPAQAWSLTEYYRVLKLLETSLTTP
ncbi:MAG: glycogen debranching enzyme N-terminal domain-containing protein, partial [Victivallales bacterium]|nr:glycogen debranching enzyme N-terminal domain-containing protein [Victivallales bacterium]